MVVRPVRFGSKNHVLRRVSRNLTVSQPITPQCLLLINYVSKSCCNRSPHWYNVTKLNSVALVRERTISSERPPLVNEVSAKFVDRRCRVVSATDPYGRILGFLDRSRYFFFQAAPQLYSRGWVDPVPDPLLLRKSGIVGNRTRTSGSVARNSDH
jgi:hypothetical protein